MSSVCGLFGSDGPNAASDDISTTNEVRLGRLVRERYGVDYYTLDCYPLDKACCFLELK